jgi:signal recognition particle subunit SRP54
MKMVANVPIKYLGIGEKLDEIEEFYADRLASRILGQGDVVSLVEKAIENVNREDAENMAKKLMKGSFNLEDMLAQLKQIQKIGSIGGIMGMLPGMSKFSAQIEAAGGDKIIKKQGAIILSMTIKERRNPDIIKASRKKRIAAGAGVEVHEVNKLLKSYEQMSTMMKQMGKLGGISKLLGSSLLKNSPFGGMGGKLPF